MEDIPKYPTLFDMIAVEFKKANIPHILVGGFAVNSYNVLRATQDVDFLIEKNLYPKVSALLKKFGYEESQQTDISRRLSKLDQTSIDIDFLLVDQKTMEGIQKEGRQITIVGQSFLTPSLQHLMALKLHAIKQNPKNREVKDLPDIIRLIRENRVDVFSDEFKSLCTKYGPPNIYSKINDAVRE